MTTHHKSLDILCIKLDYAFHIYHNHNLYSSYVLNGFTHQTLQSKEYCHRKVMLALFFTKFRTFFFALICYSWYDYIASHFVVCVDRTKNMVFLLIPKGKVECFFFYSLLLSHTLCDKIVQRDIMYNFHETRM